MSNKIITWLSENEFQIDHNTENVYFGYYGKNEVPIDQAFRFSVFVNNKQNMYCIRDYGTPKKLGEISTFKGFLFKRVVCVFEPRSPSKVPAYKLLGIRANGESIALTERTFDRDQLMSGGIITEFIPDNCTEGFIHYRRENDYVKSAIMSNAPIDDGDYRTRPSRFNNLYIFPCKKGNDTIYCYMYWEDGDQAWIFDELPSPSAPSGVSLFLSLISPCRKDDAGIQLFSSKVVTNSGPVLTMGNSLVKEININFKGKDYNLKSDPKYLQEEDEVDVDNLPYIAY